MINKDWYQDTDSKGRLTGIYREEKIDKLLWIAPSLVRFRIEEVVWLIEHLPLLISGIWPEPPGGNYIDPVVGRTGVSSHAYYEITCWYSDEIVKRLAIAGVDGKLLLAEVQGSIEPLSAESLMALRFVSGWQRKKDGYTPWQAKRNYDMRYRIGNKRRGD